MRLRKLLLAATLVLLHPVPRLSAQTWHIVSKVADSTTDTAYNGFGRRMIKGSHNVTAYNSISPPTTNCAGFPDNDTLGIQTVISGQTLIGHFFAPSSAYWHFQVSAVGKVLYDAGNRFLNPRDGLHYPYRMYFGSQSISGCGHDGWGTAYSSNSLNWIEGPTTPMIDNATFFCQQWQVPCPLNSEIISPFILTPDNDYWSLVFLFGSLSGCTNYTDLCYPSNPANAGTATYMMHSTDGLAWTRYDQNNGQHGRVIQTGIDATSPCYHASWLINVDWAYDPATFNFYMVRSFATNYGGTCSPDKLPDRVQVYKTTGLVGVFYNGWQPLIDLGCTTSGTVKGLGFQPDSATIIHDGYGNVIKGADGSIQLMVNASSNTSVCGLAPSKRYKVVIAP